MPKGLAEVRFGKSVQYVETRNLEPAEKREREQRAAKKKAEEKKQLEREARQSALRRQAKLKLRTLLHEYRFEEAEAFYQQWCSSWIDAASYKAAVQECKDKQTHNKQHEILLKRIVHTLRDDFLGAEELFRTECEPIVTRDEFEREKNKFVEQWIENDLATRANSSKSRPDDEQVTTIGAVNGHIQVVARAGSGKTSTLVNRVIFLLVHCRVPASEIMVLAFNRRAALEVRRRLLVGIQASCDAEIEAEMHSQKQAVVGKRGSVGVDDVEASVVQAVAERHQIQLPFVMTFHALAYAVVHPEESILYNDAQGEQQTLNRVVQQVIDDALADPIFYAEARKLMLSHFRTDWNRISEGRVGYSREEQLRVLRSRPRESISGSPVKSYGEKLIADFLFEHDITYTYERNHWWNGVNYRPDFTIFKDANSGVIIEYFGMAGDPQYDATSDEKRKYWNGQRNWSLVELFPSDINNGNIESCRSLIKDRLEDNGVNCVRLSEDEIWHRVRDRAIGRFTTAVSGFIGKCRKKMLEPEDLRNVIAGYSPLASAEGAFLRLAEQVYGDYLVRLAATGEDDFDGLIQRAVETVSAGATVFERKTENGDLRHLNFVCIDEFQDFSELFYQLLTAIREVNPSLDVFAVGDDWQAINGFAGSDLKFYNDFETHIGEHRKLHLATNYRSCKSIVEVGNSLMEGMGRPAIAHGDKRGSVCLADLEKFVPSPIEKERHKSDVVTPAVCRLVAQSVRDGDDVVILCRKKFVPWFVSGDAASGRHTRDLSGFVDFVRSFFPEDTRERITGSTTHKYKGLESPAVIVLDAVERSYPMIHPDWVFTRVFGDSPAKIENEERRLLYVALTRATDRVTVITEGFRRSPFLDEIEKYRPLQSIVWHEYAPVAFGSERVVVRVGSQDERSGRPTYAIKELLKAEGYEWRARDGKEWVKTFSVESFDIDTLKGEVWAEKADGVYIRVLDESGNMVAFVLADQSGWKLTS